MPCEHNNITCPNHDDVLRRIEKIEEKVDQLEKVTNDCMMIDKGIIHDVKSLKETFRETKMELLAVITEQNRLVAEQYSKQVEQYSKQMKFINTQACTNMQAISDQANKHGSRMWKVVVILIILLAAAMGWNIADKSGVLKFLLGGG